MTADYSTMLKHTKMLYERSGLRPEQIPDGDPEGLLGSPRIITTPAGVLVYMDEDEREDDGTRIYTRCAILHRTEGLPAAMEGATGVLEDPEAELRADLMTEALALSGHSSVQAAAWFLGELEYDRENHGRYAVESKHEAAMEAAAGLAVSAMFGSWAVLAADASRVVTNAECRTDGLTALIEKMEKMEALEADPARPLDWTPEVGKIQDEPAETIRALAEALAEAERERDRALAEAEHERDKVKRRRVERLRERGRYFEGEK